MLGAPETFCVLFDEKLQMESEAKSFYIIIH